ncbi:MAG: prenyltransferase [Clostridia bacterium]|nr:prenyltransferase [Clostridia bacterium]
MLKRFLSYVEIRTKITSLFAFGMTLSWLFATGNPIRWDTAAVFFASMFLFDLTTTAINNYVDTKTNGQELQFSRGAALAILWVLLLASAGLGVLLVVMTDWTVLLFGGLCFLCGVFYTWGPLPISRLPLGEVFSGLFYGLLIPFILLYINMPEGTYLTLTLRGGVLTAAFYLPALAQVLLLAAAPACATANIMLANNICDLPRDIQVKRHTLPYYLGVPRSLKLFAALYYLPFGAAVLMVALGMLPWVYLLLLSALIPIQKNIDVFFKRQEKAETFVCSIKNFVILMSADVIMLAVCRWF